MHRLGTQVSHAGAKVVTYLKEDAKRTNGFVLRGPFTEIR